MSAAFLESFFKSAVLAAALLPAGMGAAQVARADAAATSIASPPAPAAPSSANQALSATQSPIQSPTRADALAQAQGKIESLAQIDRGAYLVHAAGCADCHTPLSDPDHPFAGGMALPTPFGVFYTPNITPDKVTGIGSWSESDFRRALRDGVSPRAENYYPTFPYRSYSKISDQDMNAMYAYLKTVPATERRNSAHQLGFPLSWMPFPRAMLGIWKMRYFRAPTGDVDDDIKIARGPFRGDAKKSKAWNRGAYLVESFMHCAECHTHRDRLGGPELAQWMAGSEVAVGGMYPPDITPDETTGLALWSEDDWTRFLGSGIAPDGSEPHGDMAHVIQNTSALTISDRDAVVEYLRSLAPIQRTFAAPEKASESQ